MALEAVVFRQDQPFGSWNSCGFDFEEEEEEVAACHQETLSQNGGFGFNPNSDSSFCSMIQSMMTNSFSCDGFFAGENPAVKAAPTGNTSCRRKRRRTRSSKNKEEVENQRMTHIAVERNRRKQMNDYLAVLRSLMPPSYVQRGDQASVVGGAINYVKELEQHLQFLESHKRLIFQQQPSVDDSAAAGFSDFFSSPQYSTACSKLHSHQNWKQDSNNYSSAAAEKRSAMAEVEVTMVESHANLKIVSKRHPPKQLLKMVTGLHSLGLNVLHLNVTTLDFTVLYCFSVKVEEECQMVTVNEIAAAVYELVGGIQDDVAL
ncbi:hypothetical protein JRO89_XS08G0246300 [Xanthoceras sorbifolium]|uniref:BHLH domain-containing protein n=1 Tax=Xanthoceras sorbifolium TaxID=99658 RepID=A0ABQ8HRA1_9ROSI|nr:hypothetical protein JRO89_XS08G0246300 [Xanthoceras sorbifolium]